MNAFLNFKNYILASVLVIACLLLNFSVARQNMAMMTLLAKDDYDLLNVKFIALAMTLCGFVFSSVTIHLFQRGLFAAASICAVFTVGIFFYECQNVISSFAESHSQYEANSDAAKLEKMRLELAQKKLDILAVGKVDNNQAADRLAYLQKLVLAKEANAKKCKFWRLECKTKALQGSEELAAEINALHAKLDNQTAYVSALNEAEKQSNSADDNKKTFPVFQMISRFFYDSIDHAKRIQATVLIVQSVLIVLLAQSSLAISMLILPSVKLATAHKPHERVAAANDTWETANVAGGRHA